ncbi:hypothetical protein ABCY62_15095, partial [Acetivibrio clariflavus]
IKPWGSAPNPVLAGRQPVCHNRPGIKRIYNHWMSRGKMNSHMLALDIHPTEYLKVDIIQKHRKENLT